MISCGGKRILLTGSKEALWCLEPGDGSFLHVRPPCFEVNDLPVEAVLEAWCLLGVTDYPVIACREWQYEGRFTEYPELRLRITFRLSEESPVVRFRYALYSLAGHRLSKADGRDAIRYFGLSATSHKRVSEVRFSEFNETVHSFCPSERLVPVHQWGENLPLMGPMILAEGMDNSLLAAYEHGSQVPDAFLSYRLDAQGLLTLHAVKGNYPAGRHLAVSDPFVTVWFQLAVHPGSAAELAPAYRTFVLRHLCLNTESRRPYIFYNTWANQERSKWWRGRPYLEPMHEARILEEIDIAHRMGIEVFVLDTGWYEKTGDWEVNRKRFPRGMAPVREKLAQYGMKLGLWFNPLAAAVSSRMLASRQDCVMSWNGLRSEPHPVWETEESVSLCLVSRYADDFADELIRLSREEGVTYFKWDAIGQYGCNDAGHDHGGPENAPEERADCYAYELGLAMTQVVDRVCASCPDAIIDFDITEGERSVGLGFLSAGKYFLINNGPYFMNYDVPIDQEKNNVNLFFYPGQARGRICRTPLGFDKWLPSVLFLTHYLPDDPADNQWMGLASLVLGQNGIWGDLSALSEDGIRRFGQTLRLYRQVRDDITCASPVRSGSVGGSPEIHEKVNPVNGRGVVCLFTGCKGTFAWITESTVAEGIWCSDGLSVERLPSGHALITARYQSAGGGLVFFGVDNRSPAPAL